MLLHDLQGDEGRRLQGHHLRRWSRGAESMIQPFP
jgi:hypothetical protein